MCRSCICMFGGTAENSALGLGGWEEGGRMEPSWESSQQVRVTWIEELVTSMGRKKVLVAMMRWKQGLVALLWDC